MAETQFDRLENQLSQVIQGMATMQTRIDSLENTLLVTLQAQIDSITTVQTRIDSIEGTLLVAMRLGFSSLQSAIDDLDYDLNVTEIKTERNARRTLKLRQRVTDIETRLDDNLD